MLVIDHVALFYIFEYHTHALESFRSANTQTKVLPHTTSFDSSQGVYNPGGKHDIL